MVIRHFPVSSMEYLRISKERIKQFKDIHKGERCFIIGTGPSLNRTNLQLIKNEVLFGVNLLFQWEDKFGIRCNYYCLADHRSMWMYPEIVKHHNDVFLSCSAWGEFMNNMDKWQKYGEPYLIEKIGTGCGFSEDMSIGCYWGGTVVFDPALQLAYYMGFDEVYLLGCDLDYSGQHYVDPNIRCTGVVNYDHVLNAYRVAKLAYEKAGKIIINCTVGGKLEEFSRQSLEEVTR